jgi:hypothetical protein
LRTRVGMVSAEVVGQEEIEEGEGLGLRAVYGEWAVGAHVTGIIAIHRRGQISEKSSKIIRTGDALAPHARSHRATEVCEIP